MQRIQCNFPCRAGGREFHPTLTRCCVARLSEKCVGCQGTRGSEHNGHHSQQIGGKEVLKMLLMMSLGKRNKIDDVK